MLAKNKTFCHRELADRLAKHGILFLGEREIPTAHQETAFPDYTNIRKVILKDVGKLGKATRTKLVDGFRACKDTYPDDHGDDL
ncbi:hypothetical protein EMPS_07756 [Entomortierella parvispora]|uniref:Uncharacterized protein n=1 Tax=Entomortierella parvispora TaxID=205924 RepID=A0A9P3LYR4_9FUNG|nr:hypothetical protein EMPS_07756 [Entomortierella parvispora]